ncbi:WD40-repeat-containing domain protein [Mycena galericulata]|nr:WD40-repeat-containing domain protein [Mycena galericulata]
MDGSSVYTWTPPEFDFSGAPKRNGSWDVSSHSSLPGNFARSAKWCPDGSAALAQCEHREFRLLSPASDIQNAASSTTSHTTSEMLERTLPQPAPILDYAWYPTASASNPASFCFAASVRETPVKLLDASDGRLRASYPIVDHRERQIAPHSLAFNLSATRLYCGFEDAIEVFDVARPGEGTRLPTSPSKKSRDGLKGIISSLAFSPSYDSDFYAAGSLAATTGNIAMFSESDGAVPVLFVSGGPPAGVTQLHFNPAQPNILYAAFRRKREIYSWDLRADVDTPLKIYSSEPSLLDSPAGDTNQKRRFDIDVAGRFLAVGDQGGFVSVYDLSSNEADTATPIGTPRLTYSAHTDAIGSVSFHPTTPSILSVSGSRHFHTPTDEDSESDSPEGDTDNVEGVNVRRRVARPTPVPLDPSIRLWDFGVK